MSTAVATLPTSTSLIERTAQRFDVEPSKLMETLKLTCFKTDKPITTEQMMALLIVAEQYRLNPFTKELFAFADGKGGIVPFVSVDGWSRIINENPQYDGASFDYDEKRGAMTCTMHRKDRSHPTVITEYLKECRRNTGPWNSHTLRMLRHKTWIQAARLAFGFAGIYDEDEARAIRETSLIGPRDRSSSHREHAQRVLRTSAEHLGVERGEVIENDTVPAAEESLSPLQQYMADLHTCDDRDEAGDVLDRARGMLPDDEYAQLVAAFTSAFDEDSQP